MQTETKRIWGIEYQEEYDPEIGLVWCPEIRNPFYFEGKLRVGLNEKFLRQALNNNVNLFMLKVGNRTIPMEVPSEKEIKKKIKNKEYEERKSMFENSPPMTIIYFEV